MEFDDENQLAVDVDRAQIRYAPSDRFSISAGRMHTPLGYWNQTFHHGAWFQTTAERLQMYLFEDDGGILPVHEIGLQAAGTIPSQALAFKYSVSLANGRGRIPDDVTNVAALAGFEVGGDAWLDTIPSDPDVVGRESEIRKRILGGHVAYVRSNVELLAELSEIPSAPKSLASDGSVKQYVAGNSHAIGYVDSLLLADSVTALGIEGKAPGEPGYPLARH